MNPIAELFHTFAEKRSTLEWHLDAMRESLAPYEGNIVLYGAGSAGIAFFEYLTAVGIRPAFFADGNPDKCGQLLHGTEIISPKDICTKTGTPNLVIVTINTDGRQYCKSFDEALRTGGHQGVYARLRDAGCQNIIDYTFFRRWYALFCGDQFNLPGCWDIDLMCRHQPEIEQVYHLLGDTESKEVLRGLVEYRLLDDTLQIKTHPQEDKNFYRAQLNCETSYFDCGAFDGITLREVLKRAGGEVAQYYAVEPDCDNFRQLERLIQSQPQAVQNTTQAYCCAVSNKQGFARMQALGGPGSYLSHSGQTQVLTRTIDEILQGSKVTHIKMNIEGSELAALEGATQAICTHNPHLAIAGYHKTWDLWEIPIKIMSCNENYQLSLRSYMNHISFLYYAIPK